jgi:hypothetical protein
MNKIDCDLNELIEIWELLEFEELLSLRKSNHFNREMIKEYNKYMSQRTIKTLIPLCTAIVCKDVIMQSLNKIKW